MANEFLGSHNLDENLKESAISGLKDTPEVKDIMGWLQGKYNTGNDFRDMALDDIVSERADLPNWEDDFFNRNKDMNKVEEFFYSVVDGNAESILSIPRHVADFADEFTIKHSKNPEEVAQARARLASSIDYKAARDYESSLRAYRLGVDKDAFSNEFGQMLGQMTTLIAGGSLAGGGKVGKVVAAAGEGVMEGGSYLDTTQHAQREMKGGIEEYKGEGLTGAATYGTLAGIIGLFGVEAKFMDKFGNFTGKDFAQGVAGEILEEGIQSGTERGTRRVENYIRGTEIDQMTPWEELQQVAKSMVLGGLGGATIGGIAVANNRLRMREILKDNGMDEKEIDKVIDFWLEETAHEYKLNASAMRNLIDPESQLSKDVKQVLLDSGMTDEQATQSASDVAHTVFEQQLQDNKPLKDNPIFQPETFEQTVLETAQNIETKKTVANAQIMDAEERLKKAEQSVAEMENAKTEPTDAKPDMKQAQFDVIQNTNPMQDDYHTGIRSVEDIKTLAETLEDSDWADADTFDPDLSRADIDNAIQTGKITVYSSYPIENGVFVSPSRMEAESYSGDGQVYSQEVNIEDVAWIDPTQGQLAIVEKQAAQTKEDVQSEIEQIKAEINALKQQYDSRAEPLPVNTEILPQDSQSKIDSLLKKTESDIIDATDIDGTDPVAMVGAELGTMTQPRVAQSQYARRLSRETGVEVQDIEHRVRDTKQAAKSADELVKSDEQRAWDMLENSQIGTDGLNTAEIAEALKRKIRSIPDLTERAAAANRLAQAYANTATRIGQLMNALSQEAQAKAFDAYRAIAEINKAGKKAQKSKIEAKTKTVKEKTKISENALPSNAEIERLTRELLGCK